LSTLSSLVTERLHRDSQHDHWLII
jgi:hypothetical protein